MGITIHIKLYSYNDVFNFSIDSVLAYLHCFYKEKIMFQSSCEQKVCKKTGPAIDRFSSKIGSPQKNYCTFISSDIFERIPKKQT